MPELGSSSFAKDFVIRLGSLLNKNLVSLEVMPSGPGDEDGFNFFMALLTSKIVKGSGSFTNVSGIFRLERESSKKALSSSSDLGGKEETSGDSRDSKWSETKFSMTELS